MEGIRIRRKPRNDRSVEMTLKPNLFTNLNLYTYKSFSNAFFRRHCTDTNIKIRTRPAVNLLLFWFNFLWIGLYMVVPKQKSENLVVIFLSWVNTFSSYTLLTVQKVGFSFCFLGYWMKYAVWKCTTAAQYSSLLTLKVGKKIKPFLVFTYQITRVLYGLNK
mgnify:CR=1 FL=1